MLFARRRKINRSLAGIPGRNICNLLKNKQIAGHAPPPAGLHTHGPPRLRGAQVFRGGWPGKGARPPHTARTQRFGGCGGGLDALPDAALCAAMGLAADRPVRQGCVADFYVNTNGYLFFGVCRASACVRADTRSGTLPKYGQNIVLIWASAGDTRNAAQKKQSKYMCYRIIYGWHGPCSRTATRRHNTIQG